MPRGGSGIVHWLIAQAELLKLQKSGISEYGRSIVVYYESIKREVKTKLIYECRCDERLTNEIEEEKKSLGHPFACEGLYLKVKQRFFLYLNF